MLAKCMKTSAATTTMIAETINSRHPPGRFRTLPQYGHVTADRLISWWHSVHRTSDIVKLLIGMRWSVEETTHGR